MKEKMRVLHVTNAYPYEEIPEYGVFVKEQIESLNERGIVNDVFFINGRQRGLRAYIESGFKLRKQIRHYDVIHCHHLFSALAVILSFRWRKPVVLSFLNDWFREVEGRSPILMKQALCWIGVSFADFTIFKSPVPAQFKNRSNIVNLPNGVNESRFTLLDKIASKEALGLEQARRYVLFVSSKDTYRAQKRYDIYREVIMLLRERRPDLCVEELVMVNQPRAKVPFFFNAADLHLLTSDYEGSPNSVKEALCCGLPVVARDVGNVADMVSGLPHVSTVSEADAFVLSLHVEKILEEEIDRVALRNSFLRRGLTMGEISGRLTDYYRSIVATRWASD